MAAFIWHPHIPGRLPNDAAVTAAVAADTTRWALAHLAAGVASGIVALAFIAVRMHLREAGETRWSGLGAAFVVLGSALYAVLPGMEFAPLAAAEVGADVQATQAALQPWFLTVLLAGALTFAIGAIGFATSITRSAILRPGLARLIATALVVMAAARFVPLAAVQFYVQGAAALIALWPLASAMWVQTHARPVPLARPMPTS